MVKQPPNKLATKTPQHLWLSKHWKQMFNCNLLQVHFLRNTFVSRGTALEDFLIVTSVEIRTRGCWVRGPNATSTVSHPLDLAVLQYLIIQESVPSGNGEMDEAIAC